MKKILYSLLCSIQGLKNCFLSEKSFRFEIILGIIIIFYLLLFKIPLIRCLFIMIFFVLILIFELFNTSIEKICDLYTKEYNKHIRDIKDMASACVLLSIFIFFCVLIFSIFY